jgi:hypothetical protein
LKITKKKKEIKNKFQCALKHFILFISSRARSIEIAKWKFQFFFFVLFTCRLILHSLGITI